jgi:hypothetical protein
VLFKGLAPKPLTVRFEDERTSSDGGAILLKATDQRIGMIASMAESFADQRDASRIKHEVEELLSQRIFGIACGYEDGNDAARIAADPVMKGWRDGIPSATISPLSHRSRGSNARPRARICSA